jgi:hypothetical protein
MSPPLYRGHAYLIDKRHGLTCFELVTGKKVWDDDNRIRITPKGRIGTLSHKSFISCKASRERIRVRVQAKTVAFSHLENQGLTNSFGQ